MTATLLTCNLAPETEGRARFLCMRLRIRCLRMTASACGIPLREALGVLPRADDGPLPFAEPMLVMCGFSGPQFHALLDSWKAQGLPPVPLKAVLTETNRRWTCERLHGELAQEHAQLNGGGTETAARD